MSLKKTPAHDRLLTEVELEIMNVIWDGAECTVRDVHEALAKNRPVAYTSVATIMKILEQKNILISKKGDKAHSYFPKVPRTEYEATSLRHLARDVFRGDPTSMMMRLLDESELSTDELKVIRTLLNERLGKQGTSL